jgi:hypothetical protein
MMLIVMFLSVCYSPSMAKSYTDIRSSRKNLTWAIPNIPAVLSVEQHLAELFRRYLAVARRTKHERAIFWTEDLGRKTLQIVENRSDLFSTIRPVTWRFKMLRCELESDKESGERHCARLPIFAASCQILRNATYMQL